MKDKGITYGITRKPFIFKGFRVSFFALGTRKTYAKVSKRSATSPCFVGYRWE